MNRVSTPMATACTICMIMSTFLKKCLPWWLGYTDLKKTMPKNPPLILWSNDATKKEWGQNLCKTFVEKHINNSAEDWPFHYGYYCDIRLFVWYCLCVKLNRRARTGDRHKKDIENALKNPWLIVTWPVTVQGLIVNYR